VKGLLVARPEAGRAERSTINDGPEVEHPVVVGGSAGAMDAVALLVEGLPADLAAAVCVVFHLSPRAPSRLPAILQPTSRRTIWRSKTC
jgi:chemotaxis response regulator CheB